MTSLPDLIKRVPHQVEVQVQKTKGRTRATLQEALRAECRLMFRTSRDTDARRSGAQVPVVISHGLPTVIQDIWLPDDIETIMLISRYRVALEETGLGVKELISLKETISKLSDSELGGISANTPDLNAVYAWTQTLLKMLNKKHPFEDILSIESDILGVYEYDTPNHITDDRAVNRATIRLYWAVIGLVSEWLGCTVDDLTIVVLAHELSHAYTQLGADIEGRRWLAAEFRRVQPAVAEGLAQYYTDRVLRRLSDRYPGALDAYKKMLKHQPEIYKTHLNWVDSFSPEAVRQAMLEMRRQKGRTLDDFYYRLENAQTQLEPNSPRHLVYDR